jgi:alpha-tubulin suppressor-like RCC1 family protein
MYSFGRAENGALGIGPLAKDNRGPRKIPVEVTFPSSSPIVCITGGDHHYLAINKKHDVYSWGLIDDCRTGHVERPGPGGDSPVYSPTLLSLADHCGEETTRVHVHAACAGTAHSIFLVKRYGPNPKKRANDESAVADV